MRDEKRQTLLRWLEGFYAWWLWAVPIALFYHLVVAFMWSVQWNRNRYTARDVEALVAVLLAPAPAGVDT